MKEIIKKTNAELSTFVSEKKEALRTFRFGVTGSKVKNVKEGKSIRKEIAQALTVLNSRKNEK